MKKRVVSFLLLFCMLFAMSVPTFALESEATKIDILSLTEVSESIEYFEDGSYLVTTIKSTPTPRAEVYSKSAAKEVTLYDEDDEIQWNYFLIGTYTIETGVSCVCTNSTFEYNIYVNKWSLTEHNNWYSGNVAYGTAVFKKKVLFITTSTQNLDGSIACDAYGVIS